MFSSEITELSMMREKASASPPRIMVLTVLPTRLRTTNVARAESGMERNTGERRPQAAQKNQNHHAGEHQPDQAFVHQRPNGFFHKGRLIEDHGGGQRLFGMSNRCLIMSRIPLTTSMVLVSPPCFMIGR